MAMFAVDEKVEYYSASHGVWMETTVIALETNGDVQVSVKPGYRMPLAEQQQRLRKLGSKKPAEFLMMSADHAGNRQPHRSEWRVEHALALGSCETNDLGPRKSAELSWAHLLSSQNSVHHAVESLNRGAVQCPGNICVVFSKSSNCHYLLYKDGGNDVDAEIRLRELQMQLDKALMENQTLQAELSSAQFDLGKVKSLEANLAAKTEALRELETGSVRMLNDRVLVLESTLAEERQRNIDLERQLSLKTASSPDDLAHIRALEAELATEQRRCQELDRANLLLLEQKGGTVPCHQRVVVSTPAPVHSVVGGASVIGQQPDLFDLLDTNHDGVLDANEIGQLQAHPLGQPVVVQASGAGAPRVIAGGLASLSASGVPDRIDMSAFTG
mmetsp:Transcript_40166/g.92310  ORF Transcript_40166/g.92310 Transcript_40166/m.92310 type:complete len:387 (+) Transcript_40166:71-1231(+)